MLPELAIGAVYLIAFTYLCREAVGQGVTIWVLLGRTFNDISRGLENAFMVVGLVPRRPPARVSQARIRQLEHELGFDE